jgi:hypothetical protein
MLSKFLNSDWGPMSVVMTAITIGGTIVFALL